MAEPSPNGADGGASVAVADGRDRASGRFLPGNRGGPGNPHAQRVAHIRSLLLDCVTDDAIKDVTTALLNEARSGNVAAIREVYDRLLGKPDQAHKIIAAVADGLSPQQIGELVMGVAVEGPGA